MALGGVVFDVGKSNTSQLGLRSFLRAMNVNELEEPSFSPIAAETQGLQTDGDMHDSYLESVRSLNDLGLSMASQGIDVFNPSNKNPQSLKAAKLFQRYMSDANSQLAALKTGQKMAELRAELKARPNVVDLDKLPTDRPATASDLDSVYNLSTFTGPADTFLKSVNTQYAQQYQTIGQRDNANEEIRKAKEEFWNMKEQFIEQGLPEHLAQQIIESRIPQFGDATFDRGFATTQNLKRAQAANLFNRDENQDQSSAIKGVIKELQEGRDTGSLVGAFRGSTRVARQEYDTEGEHSIIRLFDKDDMKLPDIHISDDNAHGYEEIANMLISILPSSQRPTETEFAQAQGPEASPTSVPISVQNENSFIKSLQNPGDISEEERNGLVNDLKENYQFGGRDIAKVDWTDDGGKLVIHTSRLKLGARSFGGNTKKHVVDITEGASFDEIKSQLKPKPLGQDFFTPNE